MVVVPTAASTPWARSRATVPNSITSLSMLPHAFTMAPSPKGKPHPLSLITRLRPLPIHTRPRPQQNRPYPLLVITRPHLLPVHTRPHPLLSPHPLPIQPLHRRPLFLKPHPPTPKPHPPWLRPLNIAVEVSLLRTWVHFRARTGPSIIQ